MSLDRQENPVVLITGGGSGIGKACAKVFLREGYRVFISGRDAARLETASAELASSAAGGPAPEWITADVADPAQCDRLLETTDRRAGRIDVLINNAAYFDIGPAREFSAERWRKMFDVNLHGAFYCAQAFANILIPQQQEGVILNIGSISARMSADGYSAYAASKAALNSLTRSLAVEWAGHGIRVNCLAPGHTNTEGIQEAIAAKELKIDDLLASIPLGRIAEPAEVAELALFLAGEKARYLTGQIIYLDGGRSANGNFVRGDRHEN